MEPTPSGKVQVRGRGELMHPGACAMCGSGNCDAGYVDPSVYYDYEGQVYFCMTCIEEIIATVGGLTSEEALFLKAQAEELALKLKAAEADNERISERVSHYDALFSSIVVSNTADAPSAEPEQSEQLDLEFTGVSGGGESAPEEPVVKQGPALPSRSQRGNATRRTSTIEL